MHPSRTETGAADHRSPHQVRPAQSQTTTPTTEKSRGTSVSSYDAVVIGGAPYTGRLHKDARRFVRRHRRALTERPLRLLSSGPLDASASERDIPPVSGAQRAMTRLGAGDHATSGGCLGGGVK
ncbi:flavodoxin domain-containing protein [Streptomyces canus]|uniref:flavodoxin domain-containing protein n=1 Tax=Streptomyces canus TaxID=58343 RepID=UPI002E3051E0|nr:flavodoxin domain-containing protein [Streptomyces canus]